ncbi:hypothetical protein SLS58_010099 [Diplodia intermedia]|uniref:Vacuolar calcium ion transporter n=1 Tax=Diplodia intermedia TaxID=856260 RepID=A0ABR3T875_9PEZI
MARRTRMSEKPRDASESTAVERGGTTRPKPGGKHRLPLFNHNGHRVTTGIHPDGESGRRGIHPMHFLRICFRSSAPWSKYANILWPVVPVAIIIGFAKRHAHSDYWNLAIFILNYIAMVPAANLIGFGGEELARKIPKVIGIVVETTLGSIVEIVLFAILITKPATESFNPVQIIQAAILGSVLANLLLCIGGCFFVGGLRREEQEFHEAVSEVGSGLMLVAGTYINTLQNSEYAGTGDFELDGLKISRATAIILLISYVVYVWFQTHSHHGLYDEVFEHDELKDEDRHEDLAKEKLTLTECFIALIIAIGCVCCIAYLLVDQIHYIVEVRHVKDAFVGLILIPVVEKAAEHLTAIDEAYDNQMNFALAHVLGACIQTVMLNTPIVVFIGWGLGKDMSLAFEPFQAIVLILAILVVGSFLRDGKSNYLEGFLCFIAYLIIAVCAYYYPNPTHGATNATAGGESTTSTSTGH